MRISTVVLCRWFAAAAFAAALTSCASNQRPSQPNRNANNSPAPQYLEHTVGSGETLGIIADWYTGRASNWQAIAAANPGLRPERLRVGQMVLIPRDIMVRDTPPPRGHARSVKKKGPPAEGNATGVESTPTEPSDPAATLATEEGAKSEPATETTSGSTTGSTTEPATEPTAETAKPDETVKPAETAPTAAEAPAATETTAPAKEEVKPEAAPVPAPDKAKTPEELERDKLLDELLTQ